MKEKYQSLNRIYGDPQLLALNNRIQFIKSKHSNMKIPLSTAYNSCSSSQKKERRDCYVQDLLATDDDCERKEFTKQTSEKIELLRELKSQRYREVKQNSERYRVKISRRKQKDLQLKRIRRQKVQADEQRCRQMLQSFQQDKINTIRHAKQSRQHLNDKLQWKRIQLKRQLVQQQTRSLHIYQKSLSYKSQLMKRIKQLIKDNQ